MPVAVVLRTPTTQALASTNDVKTCRKFRLGIEPDSHIHAL